MSNNVFSDDFSISAENPDSGDYGEAVKRHIKTTKTTKANPARLTEEETAHVGLAVLKFIFVTIPLALLFAGLAVVPFTGAVFGTDLGFWTAFFVLGTLRWLIPRPRKSVLMRKGR